MFYKIAHEETPVYLQNIVPNGNATTTISYGRLHITQSQELGQQIFKLHFFPKQLVTGMTWALM